MITKEQAIAGALFDFIGFLTTRRERLCLSENDNVSTAVDALQEWAKKRDLNLDGAEVKHWQDWQDWQQPASKPSRFTMLGMASIEIYGQVHFIPVRAYEAIKENAIADFIKRMKPSAQVPIFQYIPIGYVNEESEAFVPNHTFDEGAPPGWEVTYVCRRLNQSQEG